MEIYLKHLRELIEQETRHLTEKEKLMMLEKMGEYAGTPVYIATTLGKEKSYLSSYILGVFSSREEAEKAIKEDGGKKGSVLTLFLDKRTKVVI